MLFFYFCAVNALSAILTIADKSFAKRQKWRIRESTLILVAVLGGSPAEYIVMRIIHHKTRHKKFMIGLPLIFLIQLTIVLVFLYFYKQGTFSF
ncbi:MAG: DUF1294 domain-containing protein [Clostridiales bacterium]|nr:DUF1294 domain-containing protein [Clostridiales bacterium]